MTHTMHMKQHQRGAALIVSMLILVVVTLAAISSSRTSVLEERMTQATRSRILAFEAAESALNAARREYRTLDGSTRREVLETTEFASSDCADSAYTEGTISDTAATQREGLCRGMTQTAASKLKGAASAGTAYNAYAQTSAGVPVANFSLMTDAAGTIGTASLAAAPRYLVEAVCNIGVAGTDATGSANCKNKYFRVTAIGFGSTAATIALTQEMMQPITAN